MWAWSCYRRNNPVSWKIKQGGGRRSSENISNKSTSGCLQPSSNFKTGWYELKTDFVCLYNYEFGLSLCKIVRSSVILLLPLFKIKLILYTGCFNLSAITNDIDAYEIIQDAR